MATIATPSLKIRSDDIFFPAMAILILGIVLTGFAKTYFLAGMIFAKLPNRLVHVHGAVFVSWVSLLVAQTWLVAAHKTKWHRKLGVLALIFLPAMSVLGTLTAIDFVRRAPDYETPELLLAGDLETLALFVLLTSWALLSRRDASSHKRLMILGTMAIMGPAIDRWHFGILITLGTILALPVLVLAYDLWLLKRVHRTTAVATALIAAVTFTVLPFSKLAFWHQLVEWIRRS
ncbi:MAG: hypothetical protein WAN14_24830 [Candidatus Acidiferrales bacterium]